MATNQDQNREMESNDKKSSALPDIDVHHNTQTGWENDRDGSLTTVQDGPDSATRIERPTRYASRCAILILKQSANIYQYLGLQSSNSY